MMITFMNENEMVMIMMMTQAPSTLLEALETHMKSLEGSKKGQSLLSLAPLLHV